MEPKSPNPNPQSQIQIQWIKLAETMRKMMEGQRPGIDAVIALFNAYTRNTKLSYNLIDDVIAVELIDGVDSLHDPYIAVIMTTRQGLKIRATFTLRERGIETELSMTSLHQGDCYCSCGD